MYFGTVSGETLILDSFGGRECDRRLENHENHENPWICTYQSNTELIWWIFTKIVVPGCFLSDFTQKGMEITKFYVFAKTRDFERIGPQKGMGFARNM